MCALYGIGKSRTTPYHPAGNGRVERMNQTILGMLRSLAREDQERWPESLPELLMAYNNTVHSVTGYSPSYLMFGRYVRALVDVSWGVGSQPTGSGGVRWVEEQQRRLNQAYRIVQQQNQKAALQAKVRFDQSAHAEPLAVDQRVWVRDRNRGGQGKLCPRWDGTPYVVVEVMGETGLVYKVRSEVDVRVKTLHRNALKVSLPPEEHDPAPMSVTAEPSATKTLVAAHSAPQRVDPLWVMGGASSAGVGARRSC